MPSPINQTTDDSILITPGSRILLTGATGYVGGRLAPRLLNAGYRLRCLVRSPGKLADREWIKAEDVEIVEGDLADGASLHQAMTGCDTAYYLVHSMIAAGRQYAEQDRIMAERFAQCAAQGGVKRIIYLGGLGELGRGLSEHLQSRREVEGALASTQVPVTVLRAEARSLELRFLALCVLAALKCAE